MIQNLWIKQILQYLQNQHFLFRYETPCIFKLSRNQLINISTMPTTDNGTPNLNTHITLQYHVYKNILKILIYPLSTCRR